MYLHTYNILFYNPIHKKNIRFNIYENQSNFNSFEFRSEREFSKKEFHLSIFYQKLYLTVNANQQIGNHSIFSSTNIFPLSSWGSIEDASNFRAFDNNLIQRSCQWTETFSLEFSVLMTRCPSWSKKKRFNFLSIPYLGMHRMWWSGLKTWLSITSCYFDSTKCRLRENFSLEFRKLINRRRW